MSNMNSTYIVVSLQDTLSVLACPRSGGTKQTKSGCWRQKGSSIDSAFLHSVLCFSLFCLLCCPYLCFAGVKQATSMHGRH
jgi:hypothetical protein